MAEVYIDTQDFRNLHWKSHLHCSFTQPDQIITELGILLEMCKRPFTNDFQVQTLKSENQYLQQQEDPC